MSDQADSPGRSFTIAGGAIMKYAAEAIALVFSLGTGILTARNLGPDGKGDLATMGYLAIIVSAAAGAGMGEAAVNLLAREKQRISDVVASTVTVLALTTAVGTVVFLGIAAALFADDLAAVAPAILITAATVPLIAFTVVLGTIVDSRHLFTVTTAIRVTGAAVTVVGTFLLVTLFRQGIAGAAAASLIGWAILPLVLLATLRHVGALTRPRWDAAYIRAALQIGVPVQLAQLLMIAVTRVDLLVVHTLLDPIVAGQYSVALTLGSLNTFAAVALASASFPSIAALPEAEVVPFVFRTARMTVLVAAGIAVPLAAALPWLTPLAFGHGFGGTVAPALVLLVAGLAWSAQFVLCRARAARGDGRALVRSFAASLGTMLVGDLILVPTVGIIGAAITVVVAACIGTAIILRTYRGPGASARDLIPRRHDVQTLVETLRRVAVDRQ